MSVNTLFESKRKTPVKKYKISGKTRTEILNEKRSHKKNKLFTQSIFILFILVVCSVFFMSSSWAQKTNSKPAPSAPKDYVIIE